MTELVNRVDPCSYLVVAACLHAAAATAVKLAPRYAKGTGWLAALVTVCVGGFGFAELRPDDARTMFSLAIITWMAAAFAVVVGLVVLPPAIALGKGWKDAIAAHRAAVRKFREREQARGGLASLPPPPPPPPSTSERLAEAEKAYLEELRLIDLLLIPDAEKDAVKAWAERKYLERVAGLMGMS